MRSELIQLKYFLSFLYLCVVALVAYVGVSMMDDKDASRPRVTIGGVPVVVSIANTPALQQQGLSGVQSLGENEGMLFILSTPSKVGFWMKEMLFPIDIIWVDSSRHIVDVWEHATPASYPEIHSPRVDAQYVLEVQSGFYEKHNLKIGDILELDSVARYTK